MKVIKIDRGRRLAESKVRASEQRVREEALAGSPAKGTIIGDAQLGWQDPALRGEHADAALTVRVKDKMLIRAFTEFQLNPANPYHWKLLAEYMADALFAKNGAREKWTIAAQRRLVEAVDERVQADPQGPKKAVDRAIEYLHHTPAYRAVGLTTLRTAYYSARRRLQN